jgi:hypothetical protein
MEKLRSGYEEQIRAQLDRLGVDYVYEQQALKYVPPVKAHRKTFDWWITTRTGKIIVVESKGWWQPKTRIAELECIAQNPEIDVRYVFQNPNKKIRKGSKTSYADVCRKHGIAFAKGLVPTEWLEE